MKARFDTLDEWLEWQESLHWSSIDLGLDRLRIVAEKMQLSDLDFTIITVAGTNGKGSTIALLDAILLAEGYVTGAYTSPYLYRYNERIKISNTECDNKMICAAFQVIDEVRGEISLTYFEFATLAAVWIFQQQGVQVALLEVGMGGRLDAVNLWDADVAIITSIGIDHVQWLGDNREDIGREKSGIMRPQRPVISGDLNPPNSIDEEVIKANAILLQAGEQFSWKITLESWDLQINHQHWYHLPRPALQGEFQVNNAATAITALLSLDHERSVSTRSIHQGLKHVNLVGRLQKIQSKPEVILDVAHNAHAANVLANWLQANEIEGDTYALFSMLDDKDISQVVKIMSPVIDHWYISTVNDPRALSITEIADKIDSFDSIKLNIIYSETLELAWRRCCLETKSIDRIIVFGSFLVLSEFKVIF